MPMPAAVTEQAQRFYDYLIAWRAAVAVCLPAATDAELKALVEPLRVEGMNAATQPDESFNLIADWCDDLLTIAQGGGGLDEMREYVGIVVNQGRASNQSLQESE